MELKDIVLKKGDIIYLRDGKTDLYDLDDEYKVSDYCFDYLITKIARPKEDKILYIEIEAPKEILDKEEKEYLEAVIRPFRNKVYRIEKEGGGFYSEGEGLRISIKDNSDLVLPTFPKNTMYKGMELDKEYTLEELGLFK